MLRKLDFFLVFLMIFEPPGASRAVRSSRQNGLFFGYLRVGNAVLFSILIPDHNIHTGVIR